jgi:aspartate 1-decarboxylase
MRWLMRSKIHNATVTEANLDYVGSITIDEDLIDRAGLWAGERVLVVSNTSGARLDLCDRGQETIR